MSRKHINGIVTQYIGKRDETLADLSVVLESSVGVGEHGDIGDVIRDKLEEVDRYDSLIKTVKKYFSAQEEGSMEPPTESG